MEKHFNYLLLAYPADTLGAQHEQTFLESIQRLQEKRAARSLHKHQKNEQNLPVDNQEKQQDHFSYPAASQQNNCLLPSNRQQNKMP